LKVTPSGGKAILESKSPSVSFERGVAAVGLPLRIKREGEWSFQLVSAYGGVERPVGAPQHLTFTAEGWRAWLEQWGRWLAGGLAMTLALANAALFLFARRSAWAWRLATDAGLSTCILRLATLTLSHFRKAQVWILDLYFVRHRRKIISAPPPPFLPLPLTSGNCDLDASDTALNPPWTEKRVWVQGSSGMGKPALISPGHGGAFSRP
jgi:hypothetical protein